MCPSVDIAKALPSLSYLDRKRKFQAEQLGIPQSKHVCSNQTYALGYDLLSNPNPKDQVFYRIIVKPELTGRAIADELEQESAKDSNSVGADADSMISESGEAEYQWYSEEHSFDQPSTSSVNSRGILSKNPQHSSESRSATKLSNKMETSSIEKQHNHNHPNFGLRSSMNYEDHLLEFGGHADFSCSEDRTSFEDYTDKELERKLYSNGVTSNNFVLSSRRWTVNQGNFYLQRESFFFYPNSSGYKVFISAHK
jgi:hypothetical protein